MRGLLRGVKILVLLELIPLLLGCGPSPSPDTRELESAGAKADLVLVTVETYNYPGWPSGETVNIKSRAELDKLYDILRQSRRSGEWAASDQTNLIRCHFRSGKVVQLQFGSEESVEVLYGPALAHFLRSGPPGTSAP